jgi:phosphoribosylformimino-5-aminoimidazole carboxamide ribotide isomerase
MKIIPVLDLQNGQAVAAVGGKRHLYQPLKSVFHNSPDPFSLITSIIQVTGIDTFYIADLDAITGVGSNNGLLARIIENTSAKLWLDCGAIRASDLKSDERIKTIAATETFRDWTVVDDLSESIVSIDTKDGRLISADPCLTTRSALELSRAVDAETFIHLRLDTVGGGVFDPVGLIEPDEGETWLVGGSVTTQEDIKILKQYGYIGALVGTAFHSGKLVV